MSVKKTKIMSISADADFQNLLDVAAKKGGYSSRSQLLRELVDKYLYLLVNDGDLIPVIFDVPAELRGDEAGLKTWLNSRVEAIIKKLAETS